MRETRRGDLNTKPGRRIEEIRPPLFIRTESESAEGLNLPPAPSPSTPVFLDSARKSV
jgi:hypothetical protein